MREIIRTRPPALYPHIFAPARITPAQHARIHARVFARVCPCVPEHLRVLVRELYLPSRALMTRRYHAHIFPPYLPAVAPAIVRPCAQVQTRTHAHISRPSAGSVVCNPKTWTQKERPVWALSLVGYSVPPSSAVVIR